VGGHIIATANHPSPKWFRDTGSIRKLQEAEFMHCIFLQVLTSRGLVSSGLGPNGSPDFMRIVLTSSMRDARSASVEPRHSMSSAAAMGPHPAKWNARVELVTKLHFITG
jgi:hypothetical protein